jgi:hypothetical protein
MCLVPLRFIDHLGDCRDTFFRVVEDDSVEPSRRHAAVHRAQITGALAARCTRDLRRPRLELGTRGFIVHDLARLVRHFFGDRAVNETLGHIDLGDGNEQAKVHG